LGFALKDIISNSLSGVLIIVYKPFVSSDRITMNPYEGMVLEVNLRYTVLEGENNKRIFIPNSLLFTNPIIVETKPAPGMTNDEARMTNT
jgi:small-conductance mechanosensitive channel